MVNKDLEQSYKALKLMGITVTSPAFFRQKCSAYGFGEIVLQYLGHFAYQDKGERWQLKKPTNFEDIYDFYELDSHLKNIYMIGFSIFEKTFKNALIDQLDPQMLTKENQLRENCRLISGRIVRRGEVKTRMRRIRHHFLEPYGGYKDQHGQITPWIMVKEMSFGVSCDLFFLLPQNKQEAILRVVFAPKLDLASFENLIAISKRLRQRAAHNYRLLGIPDKEKYLYPAAAAVLGELRNKDAIHFVIKKEKIIIKEYLKQHPAERQYLQEVLH